MAPSLWDENGFVTHRSFVIIGASFYELLLIFALKYFKHEQQIFGMWNQFKPYELHIQLLLSLLIKTFNYKHPSAWIMAGRCHNSALKLRASLNPAIYVARNCIIIFSVWACSNQFILSTIYVHYFNTPPTYMLTVQITNFLTCYKSSLISSLLDPDFSPAPFS
jgi:hypothetical protein